MRWLKVDLYPLREPRYNYQQHKCINTRQANMASTGMIHFGLDPGNLVCFLGGEHTGYLQDVQRTLNAVRDHVSPKDLAHMERILFDGYPAELTFEEPLSNKMEINPEAIQKAPLRTQA